MQRLKNEWDMIKMIRICTIAEIKIILDYVILIIICYYMLVFVFINWRSCNKNAFNFIYIDVRYTYCIT